MTRQYYNFLFKTDNVDTIPLAPNIAEEASRLRAFHNIRTPDAIQLATAIVGKASFFLTNDKHFPSLPNLKTLMLDDLLKDQQNAQ